MTTTNRLDYYLEPSTDTTSSGLCVTRLGRRPTPGLFGARRWSVAYPPQGAGGLLLSLLAMDPHHYRFLGTRDEEEDVLTTWVEITSNATSWESVDDDHRLAGVVAPKQERRELFRIRIDITPGQLPKRRPRFAFLDQRVLPDDE